MKRETAVETENVLLRLWDGGDSGVAMACSAKILKELRDLGCIIEERPGRIELLRVGLGCYRELIEDEAKRRSWRIGRRAVVYQRTTSTNDVCLRLSTDDKTDGAVVVADAQSQGRGRRGATWIARSGQSILMSILLRAVPNAGVDRLTLLAGLAAAEGIENALDLSSAGGIQIKWPNDLLLGGKKLAGILVERRGKHAVVGIGVNVAQAATDFPSELRHTATSLYAATGIQLDRLRIIIALLDALQRRSLQITDDSRDNAWISQWKSRCPMLGQRIHARIYTERRKSDIAGRVQDVDPLQGLLVRDDAGAMRWLSAQTTTLSPGN